MQKPWIWDPNSKGFPKVFAPKSKAFAPKNAKTLDFSAKTFESSEISSWTGLSSIGAVSLDPVGFGGLAPSVAS